ncbi:MAG: carbonic anhydrase [Rhodospirillales bacterium]|nr:carbonic anhydrase [Rhodospirillales bacterium]
MSIRKLLKGFLDFKEKTYETKKDFFLKLAERQQPRVMMIACSDSRVDPAILTNSEPGEMFVVRNVANLVPPRADDDSKHGTSAALEFAVTALEVEHIVVFGHRGCGGIKALLTADPNLSAQNTFIHNWMNIADEARRRTLIIARDQPFDHQLKTLEQEAMKTSLANLLSFPWIRERVDDNSLRLHGWYYDIHDGNMYVYVPEKDGFEPLTVELADRL